MLGAGAFGRVYRAQAKGMGEEGAPLLVAVKMMKSRSDRHQLLSLRSEIKIMMHIGRHINIVNLLGACSTDIASKGWYISRVIFEFIFLTFNLTVLYTYRVSL